ncbi:MAG: HlyD family efflux transporter periplasmic adaptor subunit [Bacteroidales bacterium]|nr:HlyD family efflux transporter periplasmic adaptor subunit [Bacteroidales bacterium]MDD4209311.1 HlyD family efflux transporter periplasmic adaptor subunit [Bacteroidales bacterium]
MKTKQVVSLIVIITLLTILNACRHKAIPFDAAGSFEATEIIVSSEANGKIMKFDIDEGMELKAGQVVGYIDTTQIYLKKLQLITSIKAINNRKIDANKQIAALQQQITTAKQEKKRIENLLKADAINRKQLDDVNAQIATLEKQLNAQSATIESTNNSISEESSAIEIQIAQLQDQIKKSYIISPIEGKVLVKYVEYGELAMTGKALFKIANLNTMTLRAYITSEQLTKLKLGQEVKVYADFGKNNFRTYKGVISWISSKSEFTPKTIQTQDERANLVYAIKIKIKNDGYLKIGMYANVDFSVK